MRFNIVKGYGCADYGIKEEVRVRVNLMDEVVISYV